MLLIVDRSATSRMTSQGPTLTLIMMVIALMLLVIAQLI